MQKKDPAALFYIANWFTDTAEMDADYRGWYINLVLHHYNQGDLPADMDTLSVLAGVKPSQYQRFNQMVNQMVNDGCNQRFKKNAAGRLESDVIKEILQSRGEFKKNSSRVANIGVVSKMANVHGVFRNQKGKDWLKKHLATLSDEEIEALKKPDLVNQLVDLYINTSRNTNNTSTEIKEGVQGEPVPGIEKYKATFDNDYGLDQIVCAANGFSPANLVLARSKFWDMKQFDSEMTSKPFGDVQQHFVRFCNLNKDKIKSATGGDFSSDDNYSTGKSAV